MKLVCPSCESGFLVDATAIGPKGRKVRCGRCGNSWLAMPVETIADEAAEQSRGGAVEGYDDAAPEAVESVYEGDRAAADQNHDSVDMELASDVTDRPDDPLRATAGSDAAPPRSRSSRRRRPEQPGRGGSFVGWALFTLCLAALVAGVVLGRHQVMAWAPETEALYVMVGLAEESPIPPLPTVQLRLREVTSGRRQVNGTPELVIEGEIFNPTDQDQNVPPLVATLMDPTGVELKRWTFAAEAAVLPPGGHAGFQTSTPNPPGQGNLNLNFVLQRQ